MYRIPRTIKLIVIGVVTKMTLLTALPVINGDLTLAPPPPPKPKVLGVDFGASSTDIVKLMQEQKIKLQKQEVLDERGVSKVLTFKGVPKGIALKNGISRFYFFRNELIRMIFHFDPNYQNFLILRQQLFNSLGDRFSIGKKEETMDTLLRARLASLDVNAFNTQAEELISSSIIEGKTFFLYSLEDRHNELDISCAFTANHNESKLSPSKLSLSLHYNHITGIKSYVKFQKLQFSNADNTPQPLTPFVK